MFERKFRAYYKEALADPRAEDAARFGLAHLGDIMANHFTKKKMMNIMAMMTELGRTGYTKEEFEGWQGRVLVVASEDDAGFKDLEWLTANLPNAESHVLLKGLGHLPQLVHREKLQALTRGLLAHTAPSHLARP